MTKAKQKKAAVIKKVIFANSGGLTVVYFIPDGETMKEYTVKNLAMSHPDLSGLVSELKPHLAVIHGASKDFISKSTDEMSKATATAFQKAITQIGVKSITVIQDLEDDEIPRKFIIGGKKEIFTNRVVPMNSPKIVEDDPDYKFASEFTQTIDDIFVEVKEYLFENKYAQASLFDEMGQADGDGEKEGIEAGGIPAGVVD